MALALLRRVTVVRSIVNSRSTLRLSGFSSSRASGFRDHDEGYSVANRIHLSPLFPESDDFSMKDCKIDLVDDETWHVSSGLADAWRRNEKNEALRLRGGFGDREDDGDDRVVDSVSLNEDPDFDEIEDTRIRRNLFYKLDKDSKEYEEYKFDFHRRKPAKNEKGRKERKESKKKDHQREVKKSIESKIGPTLPHDRNVHLVSPFYEVGDSCLEKKKRTLTFNQLTAPYHEPFCLDIYISKGSVRASVIHRATSNVVAVSHSISKDMKFDLGSTKNKSTCAAVGKVLAQRALADDIHNVVYTPRRGEKLEGKLQIVLKSIIDGGVIVKVKMKQIKMRKARCVQPRSRD